MLKTHTKLQPTTKLSTGTRQLRLPRQTRPTLLIHLLFLVLQILLLYLTTIRNTNTFTTLRTFDPFSLECRTNKFAHPASTCAVKPSRRPPKNIRFTKPTNETFSSTSFKSQFQEDQELYDLLFYSVRDGTFIEMGALDGERYSNTWFFEKEMGWRGLLIEGSPKNYEKLVGKRPEAVRVNAAVCDRKDRVLHYVDNDRDGGNRWTTEVGGFWELFDDAYKKKHHSHLTDEMVQHFPTVKCTRMEDILERFGIRHVDFWSLDVEKAEELVLRSVNWERFSASVILMEVKRATGGLGDASDGASNFLMSKGYKKFKTVTHGRNTVFAHPKFYEQLVKLYGDAL